jgi:predicted nucleotidyltransferase
MEYRCRVNLRDSGLFLNNEEERMNATEREVLSFLLKRLNLHKLILFGSRARGEAGPHSDMDVLVVLDDSAGERDFDYVSDCAWEAGFEYGIVIMPVVFTRSEWEDSPERFSLLAKAVESEGVLL